mgnify:CR=1 FL=1
MKSIHLAKADFLRQLKNITLELYQLGDFTSDNPDRTLLSKKAEGFIEAGLLIEVVTREEAQKEIDLCHLKVFGESRSARRERVQTEIKKEAEGEIDWDLFDSPAFDRIN